MEIFPIHLQDSLTDSLQPNWGQYYYVGRPDPVFQYTGVGARAISFYLKVLIGLLSS